MVFELQHTHDGIIESWVRTLGLRDQQLEGHAVRVSELSTALASSLGFKNDELFQLRSGALLHDVGKIALPDSILNKPGPLNEEEQSVMRQHPQFGREILAPIPIFQPLVDIVYCHHENWDGSGYPRGLMGENIPILARIVTVCNLFDALVSDQPYRKAWSKNEALNYIESESEKQFDPDIVEAFIRFIKHEN